ncbi:MAG: phosphopantetheine-binding protein [Oscillospiraceae bacterium]|nr:phosphopantetheine-binding protein [Oscillospiraceae bacterium]
MLEKIADILREHKGDSELEITEETAFADLELDSLEMVEMVMNVEEEFDVSIEMNESIKIVGDLIKTIESVK